MSNYNTSACAASILPIISKKYLKLTPNIENLTAIFRLKHKMYNEKCFIKQKCFF